MMDARGDRRNKGTAAGLRRGICVKKEAEKPEKSKERYIGVMKMEQIIASGVYKYVYDGEVIYIGKSKNSVLDRIHSHSKEERFLPYLNKAEILYFPCEDNTEIDLCEFVMINKYRPVLNTDLMTKEPVNVDMEGVEWHDINELKEKIKRRNGNQRDPMHYVKRNEVSPDDHILSVASVKINHQYLNLCEATNQIISPDRHRSTESERDFSFMENKASAKIHISNGEVCHETDLSITQYDIDVMDSVYTLLRHGITSFSVRMVADIMVGRKVGKVTDCRINHITASIKKMSKIFVDIDYKKRKNPLVTLSGYLLPAEQITVFATNRLVDGFSIQEIPVLYRYAEMTGSIAEISPDIIRNPMSKITDDIEMIRRYLVRKIETCKRRTPTMDMVDISYEDGDKSGLFYHLGYQRDKYNAWKMKKANTRNQIEILLNNFVRSGYVEDFLPIMDGQSFYGMRIIIKKTTNQ